MASLTNTDLAAVSTDTGIHLYYQKGAQILEAQTANGSVWTTSTAVVGDKAQDGGSPIAAYYVTHDGTSNKANPVPAIHVLYIDSSHSIREKVKVISEDNWKEREVPGELFKGLNQSSRISSGFCHDQKPGAHQWLYFERQVEDNVTAIVELRNGDASDFKWVDRKGLPQGFGEVLPGSSLATNLTNPTTHLYFQDHAYNVHEFQGGYEKWEQGAIILKTEEVGISTPLATCDSSTADKPHVFYASKGPPYEIRDYSAGKAKVTDFYPGTKLGATVFKGKPYLFHREPHTYDIVTKVLEGTQWVKGAHVAQ